MIDPTPRRTPSGMTFPKNILSWVMDGWQVPAAILVVVLQVVLWAVLSTVALHAYNKVLSPIYQVIGSGLVIYLLNKNIGTFGKNGLWPVFKQFLGRMFGMQTPVTGAVHITEECDAIDSSGAVVSKGLRRFDQRIEDLESDIRQLHEIIRNNEQALSKRIEEVNGETAASFSKYDNELLVLKYKVEQAMIGDVGSQVFGIALAAYGTILGAYFA